ncbi:hypothetical protein NC652_018798 [Populus alba x Populus x berolinensis]|nr:hypothetical protein NC652_018798 [Populus alba x Populus x berolinensis]
MAAANKRKWVRGTEIPTPGKCSMGIHSFHCKAVVKVLVLIRFKKVTRHWKILGRRAVAGRLVKESYGSAKQQHTFIVVRLCFQVEVLWSKGVKKLPPLPVEGRNLSK